MRTLQVPSPVHTLQQKPGKSTVTKTWNFENVRLYTLDTSWHFSNLSVIFHCFAIQIHYNLFWAILCQERPPTEPQGGWQNTSPPRLSFFLEFRLFLLSFGENFKVLTISLQCFLFFRFLKGFVSKKWHKKWNPFKSFEF